MFISTDVYEQLKFNLYQDDAVTGEAAGVAMGLVMLGSKSATAIEDMVAVSYGIILHVLIQIVLLLLFVIYFLFDNFNISFFFHQVCSRNSTRKNSPRSGFRHLLDNVRSPGRSRHFD